MIECGGDHDPVDHHAMLFQFAHRVGHLVGRTQYLMSRPA